MKRKLIFDFIAVEITRRCNLSCAHCLRGEAQNADISPHTIDLFLDKTARIDILMLTGGEPSLNVEAMRYLLDGLKMRKIPLKRLEIFSNGIIQSAELVDCLRDYDDYMRMHNQDSVYRLQFRVSSDRYHETDSESHVEFWKQAIGDFALVRLSNAGEVVYKYGRGKQLKDSTALYRIPYKICYFTPEKHDFICTLTPDTEPEDDYIRIPCDLYLSYDGLIYDFYMANAYDDMRSDNLIFDLHTEDVEKAIDDYNRDKPYCQIVGTAQGSNYNLSRKLKDLGIYGLQQHIVIRQGVEGASKLTEIPRIRQPLENVYRQQWEKSTTEDIITAIYQSSFEKPPEELNQKDVDIINKTYAEMKEEYRKTQNGKIQT